MDPVRIPATPKPDIDAPTDVGGPSAVDSGGAADPGATQGLPPPTAVDLGKA